MTPSGIEPVTFRLVAQCFNQLRYHRTPPKIINFHNNLKHSKRKFFCNVRNTNYYYYYYYYYLVHLSFHSVAVVLTLVTNKNKYT